MYYGHIRYKLQKQNKTLVTDPPLKNKKQKTQNCNPVKLNEYLPSIYFYSNYCIGPEVKVTGARSLSSVAGLAEGLALDFSAQWWPAWSLLRRTSRDGLWNKSLCIYLNIVYKNLKAQARKSEQNSERNLWKEWGSLPMLLSEAKDIRHPGVRVWPWLSGKLDFNWLSFSPKKAIVEWSAHMLSVH